MREMLVQRMEVGDFPGYHRFCVSKERLDLIVSREVASWRGALSAVAGVYVITDTNNGKLYVGSATGEGGIWSRRCAYSQSGHGGNAELRAVLKANGPRYASNFQFAVLEIADTHASTEEVLARESYWKDVFKCREHGYNAN